MQGRCIATPLTSGAVSQARGPANAFWLHTTPSTLGKTGKPHEHKPTDSTSRLPHNRPSIPKLENSVTALANPKPPNKKHTMSAIITPAVAVGIGKKTNEAS